MNILAAIFQVVIYCYSCVRLNEVKNKEIVFYNILTIRGSN